MIVIVRNDGYRYCQVQTCDVRNGMKAIRPLSEKKQGRSTQK
jgi:hypothetical protein